MKLSTPLSLILNIGITYDFHALTFVGSRGSCLNMRSSGQTPSRDTASVIAMKQTCMIDTLVFYLIPTKIILKTLVEHLTIIFSQGISIYKMGSA